MQEVVHVLVHVLVLVLACALCHCAVVPVLPLDVVVGYDVMR